MWIWGLPLNDGLTVVPRGLVLVQTVGFTTTFRMKTNCSRIIGFNL
ncbi:hypothetical protein FHT71_002737 [Rhizobium sp. BK060]|nr:hypothetical protein [Rhizobium sp. BK060]